MPDVWPVHPTAQDIDQQVAVVVASLGDGYEQRALKSQAFSHADLMGNVTSHVGLCNLNISYDIVKMANADSNQEFNKIKAFIDAHWIVAFYFYNSAERSTPDLTGADTTGRYLVRIEAGSVKYKRVFNKLHAVSLRLVEVRA